NIDALDVIEKTSLDFYSQLKSIVRQRRQVDLRAVRPVKDEPGDSGLLDPGAPPAQKSPDEGGRKEGNTDAASKPPPLR
ncbi:MAG: hypothetical protein QOK44_1838, partial [Betaproteobacteria bacterium]|nr:hypothetical protein [Betaproteobacteria bacterium]